MKKIISIISIIMSVAGVFTSMAIISNHFVIGSMCLAWFIGVIIILSKKLMVMPRRIKAFTMIELIMVMVIMAFLLTMAISIPQADRSKAEASKIGSELKTLHQQSLTYDNDYGFSRPFILDQNDYASTITLSHPELFFNKGEIFDENGNQIIGYNIKVKHKQQAPVKIIVSSFTGKIKYY